MAHILATKSVTALADGQLRIAFLNGGTWSEGAFRDNHLWIVVTKTSETEISLGVSLGDEGNFLDIKAVHLSCDPTSTLPFCPKQKSDKQRVPIPLSNYLRRWANERLATIRVDFAD